MMGWYDDGWSYGWMFAMMLGWVVLIALAVWAVVALTRRSDRRGRAERRPRGRLWTAGSPRRDLAAGVPRGAAAPGRRRGAGRSVGVGLIAADGGGPVDQRHVLVVDDEQPLARIVGSYLQAEGFTVALAHDGPSAVEAARAGDPDLVVLDVMMPGFDGIEACRRIRAFSDCYIIMLTARDEEIDKVVGLSVGADDYLVKPFSPRELVARVRAMLRRPRTRTRDPGTGRGRAARRGGPGRRPRVAQGLAVRRRARNWTSPAPSSTCWPRWQPAPGGRSPGASSSTRCGARTGSATSTSSTSTSGTCAASSATAPPIRRSSAPSAASATAWPARETGAAASPPGCWPPSSSCWPWPARPWSPPSCWSPGACSATTSSTPARRPRSCSSTPRRRSKRRSRSRWRSRASPRWSPRGCCSGC